MWRQAISCLILGLVIGFAGVPSARAQGQVSHALAMHGQPKYGPDFRHFDYVNPHAPKGGTLRVAARGTFDSFHPFIPKGNAAFGSGYFESLLTHSADEPFTMYGLIAATVETPEDRSWVIFTLRPEADGQRHSRWAGRTFRNPGPG